MTLAELKRQLSTELGESANEFYTEAERLTAINLGVVQLISDIRLPLKEISYEYPIADDNSEYIEFILPEDFFSLVKVYAVDSDGKFFAELIEKPYGLWHTYPQKAQLYHYTLIIEETNVKIRAVPLSGKALVVHYIPIPPTLSSDTDELYSELNFLKPFHFLIVKWAAYYLLQKDERAIADRKLQDYQLGLIQLRKVLSKHQKKMEWRYA